jgi:[NiFe] hydrogenase assembly HybE family chaperone
MNLDDDHPRSGFAAPPQGGNASGPAEPDPRRLLGSAVVSTDSIRQACADRASPAQALESVFGSILRERMQDMPMLNPALAVEAVGFRHWGEHWLGILITPWFMNLMLMPRVSAKWQPIGERETRHYVLPAGVFEFIGGRDPALGDYQACSLFSPMFEFSAQQEARDTAVAALEALFDPAQRDAGGPPVPAPASSAACGPGPAASAQRLVSKRDLLFGLSPRAARGP